MSFIEFLECLDGEEEQMSGRLLLLNLLLQALNLPDLVSHDLVHVVNVVAPPLPGLSEENRSFKKNIYKNHTIDKIYYNKYINIRF